MYVYKYEEEADFCEKVLLNTQKKNGKTVAPT
jgi:hypothetical protein